MVSCFIVAFVCLLAGGYLSYKYGRSVENTLWSDFMAARGFSEKEFEAAKKLFERGVAVAKDIAQDVKHKL